MQWMDDVRVAQEIVDPRWLGQRGLQRENVRVLYYGCWQMEETEGPLEQG